jgi:kinesin family protein 11
LKQLNAQKAEADDLRQQLQSASDLAIQSTAAASTKLEEVLREEKEQAAIDRQNLLSQISSLVMAQGEIHDSRLGAKIEVVQQSVASNTEIFEASRTKYSQGMDAWNDKEMKLVAEVLQTRETLKSKLKEDWVVRIIYTPVDRY